MCKWELMLDKWELFDRVNAIGVAHERVIHFSVVRRNVFRRLAGSRGARGQLGSSD